MKNAAIADAVANLEDVINVECEGGRVSLEAWRCILLSKGKLFSIGSSVEPDRQEALWDSMASFAAISRYKSEAGEDAWES